MGAQLGHGYVKWGDGPYVSTTPHKVKRAETRRMIKQMHGHERMGKLTLNHWIFGCPIFRQIHLGKRWSVKKARKFQWVRYFEPFWGNINPAKNSTVIRRSTECRLQSLPSHDFILHWIWWGRFHRSCVACSSVKSGWSMRRCGMHRRK